jgi:Uncharacterized conserved protein (DUF2280)
VVWHRKWVDVFQAACAEFTNKLDDIAIAQKAARLRRLQRIADRAEDIGNLALALQTLEQAAKEMGDVFTNRCATELTGRDGGPVETRIGILRDALTDEELEELRGYRESIKVAKETA